MKYIRLSLFFALALCLVLSICPSAFAATEGTCGPDATWHFEDGTLTISGTGPVIGLYWYGIRNTITEVVVEPGITSLPEYAFKDCEYLQDVTLPEGLTEISDSAFDRCHSMRKIDLPSTLITIGKWAFRGSGLIGITLPDGLTEIGISAFENCENLEQITLPQSLHTIGHDAFAGCTALTNIVLPEKLISVPESAFLGCKNLQSVTLSPKTTRIEIDAFSECPSLRSITLPPTIQLLHGLPSTLQEIHISDLAAWCTANHSRENNYLEYAGLYLNGELITDLVIPEGCSSISYGAFYGYKQLTSVTIPEGLTTIGGNAFENCTSLKQVALPSTIEHIGDYAFSGTTALHQVIYNGSILDFSKISILRGNDSLLRASWNRYSLEPTVVYIYSVVSLALTCLLQLGVLIACLVIYIRQRMYPFL